MEMHGDFNARDTDKYGHSDGFVKWCGGNSILMGNHGDQYPEEAAAIRHILENMALKSQRCDLRTRLVRHGQT